MNDLKVDDRRLKWLREQMNMACDMSESVETLRKWGFSDPTILDAFEAVRVRGNALADGSLPPPLIRRNPKNLHRVDNPHLELYIYSRSDKWPSNATTPWSRCCCA